MKSITCCLAAVAATSLPSSGSLSNLDRKYGTSKGAPRKASNTTTRMKSGTARRNTRHGARPGRKAAAGARRLFCFVLVHITMFCF